MDFQLFGAPGRSLFGCLHAGAKAGPSAGVSVLLCPPWGQEAIRTQRMFRVLAERLSRTGATVLRFDYFGTGDSAGDDADVSVDGCCADIATAHARLLEAAPSRRVVWVGVRLGGTLPLLTLGGSSIARPPEHLVAWEPIVDGAQYLESIRQAHVDALEASFTAPRRRWRLQLRWDSKSFRDEAMGFAVPDRFREQLRQIQASALAATPLKRVTVLTPGGPRFSQGGYDALGRAAPSWEFQSLEHAFDWTSEEALNTALVPGPAVQRLLELSLEERHG